MICVWIIFSAYGTFGNIFGRLDRHIRFTLRYLSVLRGMLGVE